MPGNEELKFRGNVLSLCYESSYLLEVNYDFNILKTMEGSIKTELMRSP